MIHVNLSPSSSSPADHLLADCIRSGYFSGLSLLCIAHYRLLLVGSHTIQLLLAAFHSSILRSKKVDHASGRESGKEEIAGIIIYERQL